jgi:hypothetical protein
MTLPAQSYSSLKLFEQCPRKYYHLRVVKDIKEPTSEAMYYGTDMHKAAEDYIQDGTALPERFSYVKSTLDNLKRFEGERICEYKMGLTATLKPCAFDAEDVWFRGIIDLAILNHETGEGRIVDYKTGKSAKYADTGQLELMALGVFKHFPTIKKIKAGLLFVVCKAFIKDKYDLSMEPKLWEKWLRHYSRIETAYKTNVWNPNPSGLCRRHCSVHSCPHNGSNR